MAKRITQKLVREVLKKEYFRPDSPPRYLYRNAPLVPGMSVMEYKFNGKGKQESFFTIDAYQGAHVPKHWDSIVMVSLKEAVAWANEHVEETTRIWESEVG